jgi:hypothetical protein
MSTTALADGIHPRRPWHGGDDPQSLGPEHLAGRGGEGRIAIMNKELQRAGAVTRVYGEVAGLLHRPRAGQPGGHPGQVQPAGAVLDEYQHVQPLEQHGFHRQEVTGDDRVRPGGQELPPCRP